MSDLDRQDQVGDTHPTHTTWTFWYHNPVDKNWDLKSYTKIFEFQTLEEFWRMYHS